MSIGNVEGVTRVKIGGGESKTKQSFRDKCDINKIIAKYQKTGMLRNLNNGQPFYGDVSMFKDYKQSLDKVNDATELFMKMSPTIRERFKNDPAEMIKFLENKNNLKEAQELGMVVKPPKEAGVAGGGVEPPVE